MMMSWSSNDPSGESPGFGKNSEDVLLAIKQHQNRVWAQQSTNFSAKLPVPPIKQGIPGRITREDAIWDHLQRKRQFLPDAIQQHYGHRAREVTEMEYSNNPAQTARNNTLIEDVLAERSQNFAEHRQDHLEKLRELNNKRQNLLNQQEHLRVESMSPAASSLQGTVHSEPEWSIRSTDDSPQPSSSLVNVQGAESFIRITNDLLPANIAKYNRLRVQYEAEYDRLYRPYNGELGPQSYANWQMEHYHLARTIVDGLVENFLNMFFRRLPPTVNKAAAEAVIAAESREWEHRRVVMTENHCSQLLMEELLLEVTSNESQQVVYEFLCINDLLKARADKMFMNLTEVVATGKKSGRHQEDSAYNLVTKAYFHNQQDRHKYRADTWSHTQHLHLLGLEDEEQEEIEDDDLVKIHFFNVSPMHLRQYQPRRSDNEEELARKSAFSSYQTLEAQYWQGIAASVHRKSLARKTVGVFIARPSPNHRLLGVGTTHGDIIVYDLWTIPWRPLRCIHNQAKDNDAVVDLVWSTDATHIISIQQTGVLHLWSLNSGVVSKEDLKGLELKADTEGIAPEQFSHLLTMDMDDEDFVFQSGPFSEMGVQENNYGPTLAAFHPNYTAFAKQHCFCVSLDNGDILKCDSETATRDLQESEEDGNIQSYVKTPRVHHLQGDEPPDPNTFVTGSDRTNHSQQGEQREQSSPGVEPNLVGQKVEANLLRQHRHPILLLGYVDNMTGLVSVDLQAYINIWYFDRSSISSFGWFKPKGKYKLEMSKMMFSPVSNIKPNVIFTDRSKAGSKFQKTRQQVALDRTRAQKQIDFLKLKDPWHEEYLEEQDILTQIYQTDETISKSGAVFHVIMMHAKTGQLSTYLTRVYKPVKVKSSKLLSCKLSPSGREIIFCLLFPEYPPKGAHITIVILDLHKMDVQDYRLDIQLTEKEYDNCLQHNIVSCAVSQPLGVTGSMYAFINIAGKISAYSLNSGVKVVGTQEPRTPSPDFIGCKLNSSEVVIHPMSDLTVVDAQGKLFVIAYCKAPSKNKTNSLTVVALTDNNEPQQMRVTSEALKSWKEHPYLPPRGRRIDPIKYELEELGHPAFVMRTWLLELMDKVIQDRSGSYTDEQLQAHKENDHIKGYLKMKSGYDILSTPNDDSSIASGIT